MIPALYFQLAVLDNWMQTDLPGAFNWVCQLSDADARQRALNKIIRWVQSQPDSESRNKALLNCIDELAKTDVSGALALAESLPEGIAGATRLIAWLWIKPTRLPSRNGSAAWFCRQKSCRHAKLHGHGRFLPKPNFGRPALLPPPTE